MLGLQRILLITLQWLWALVDVTDRSHDDRTRFFHFKPAMHVLVLGATGGVGDCVALFFLRYADPLAGLLLIEYLLRDSHTVVVYARTPSKLPENITSNPSVTVVKGELTDKEALKGALAGVHAIVSALGPSVKKGPLHPAGTPLAKAYALLLEVMREMGVKRLILLGTSSMKDPHDKFNLQFWVLVNGVALFARNAYKVSLIDQFLFLFLFFNENTAGCGRYRGDCPS